MSACWSPCPVGAWYNVIVLPASLKCDDRRQCLRNMTLPWQS
jgi:hypothetical protein